VLSKKRNDMKDKIFEVAKNHTENEETAMQLTNELCVLLGVSESSWAYYEKELDKIEQLNQTQSSLHKQMFILRQFANKLGLYDVADYLKR